MGLDVEKMISGSPLDFRLRVRIVERASVLKDEMDDSLAFKIINRLAESMNRGKS